MANPPQHSVDAEIIFIPESDPAWDRRYAAELDALEDAKGSSQEHPLILYMSGRTRFDLDALGTIVTGEDEAGQPTYGTAKPRDYLKPDVLPRKYHLRRLRSVEVARCEDIGGATSMLIAVSLALMKVENVIGYKLKRKPGQPLSDQQLDELRDAVGMEAVYQIGKAALRASSLPTVEEGKP